ncbi:hypothetical protein NC651_037995 [Populus alba x Populus x berolinensis]|nr:hypothetical protein NC651_037995 [Populus alba x Populus x berolinensis]
MGIKNKTSTGPRRSLNLALVRVCIDLGVMPRNRMVEAGGQGDEVDMVRIYVLQCPAISKGFSSQVP